MNYTAIYEDPFNEDGTSEDGTRVTHAIKLQISSNLNMGDQEVNKCSVAILGEIQNCGGQRRKDSDRIAYDKSCVSLRNFPFGEFKTRIAVRVL